MAKIGKVKVDTRQLKKFYKELEKLESPDQFIMGCAKALARQLKKMVTGRTQVGVYDGPVEFTTADGKKVSFTPHSGKTGGTLKKGWEMMPIRKEGSEYIVEIINPTKYASYVEYGHRKVNRAGKTVGWVRGKLMMTISEGELAAITPQYLEKKLQRYLEKAFK